MIPAHWLPASVWIQSVCGWFSICEQSCWMVYFFRTAILSSLLATIIQCFRYRTILPHNTLAEWQVQQTKEQSTLLFSQTKKLHWFLSVSVIGNSIFTYKIKEINQKNSQDIRELLLEKTGFQASVGRFLGGIFRRTIAGILSFAPCPSIKKVPDEDSIWDFWSAS